MLMSDTELKIYRYIESHQPVTTKDVAFALNMHFLTVHKYIGGGRSKYENKLFNREMIKFKNPYKDSFKGGYYYVYSVKQLASIEPIKPKLPKKTILRDPITTALFGALA